jgi:hypothetical protein
LNNVRQRAVASKVAIFPLTTCDEFNPK